MRHDDAVYLQHILDATSKVETYLEGIGKDAFLAQNLVQDGVIRQLEIIGEATKRISSTVREANLHVPWQDIAGMRDKLIHGYFGVDLDQVWLTATEDVPVLKAEVGRIREEL